MDLTSEQNNRFKTVKELHEEYGDKIPYGILLLSHEWRQRRLVILKRDENKCTKCKKIGTHLTLNGKPHYLKLEDNFVEYDWENGETISVNLPEIEAKEQDESLYLHVHHTFYILSRYPWDYQDDDLITLCQNCHRQVHKDVKVPVYLNESSKKDMNFTNCIRCGGTGRFKEYNHVNSGLCFRCNGNRYEEMI